MAMLATVAVAAPVSAYSPHFGPWGVPDREGVVNHITAADGCPIESFDGLQLYFASNRAPVGGASDVNDIYRASRASIGARWSTPVRLPGTVASPSVNSGAADFCPTPLPGKRLFFVSARSIPGVSCGAGDIYRTREHPSKGWTTPTNLGCAGAGPNFGTGEFSPSIVETAAGTILFYSSAGPSGSVQDIYSSMMRADGTFGPGTAVAELNTSSNDQMPNVSRDGLEMVFASDRTGTTGGLDIYSTTRASTSDRWSTPVKLGENVNTSVSESRPSLSGDGSRLHFGRSGDIWVSTRSK
jgi:hypothetical protein